MSDVDAWLYFDGPEPEHLRPLLAAFRALTSSTPEEEKQGERRSSEGLHAELAQEGDPSVSTAATIAKMVRVWGDRRGDELRATVRSPSFDERPAAPPPVEPPSLPVEPPSLPVAAPEPRAPERRPPVVDLKDTALELDVPAEYRERMGRWPFKPPAPGPELARTVDGGENPREVGGGARFGPSASRASEAARVLARVKGAPPAGAGQGRP